MQKNKIGLGQYLSKYRFGIFCYILVVAVASVCSIFTTIFLADTIELITIQSYDLAINKMLIILGIVIFQRLNWWASGVLYDKYSVSIMSDLSNDLARQAFKINSESFASHDTGTFVQRIVTDPEKVVKGLGYLAEFGKTLEITEVTIPTFGEGEEAEELQADIRDMEGGAIVQAAHAASLPVYSIKAISDIAGSGSTTEQFLINKDKALCNLKAELPNIFELL